LLEPPIYLSCGFKKYGRRAYETAMDLYQCGTRRFMILRAEGPTRGAAMEIVASPATEASAQVQDEVKVFLDDADPRFR